MSYTVPSNCVYYVYNGEDQEYTEYTAGRVVPSEIKIGDKMLDNYYGVAYSYGEGFESGLELNAYSGRFCEAESQSQSLVYKTSVNGASLKRIDIYMAEGCTSVTIPSPVEYFSINSTFSITTLTVNSTVLKSLDLEGVKVRTISAFPTSLKRISISDDVITSMPALPSGLEEFGFGCEAMSSIPNLPSSLLSFSTAISGLTDFSKLLSCPNLKSLSIGFNESTSFSWAEAFENLEELLLNDNTNMTSTPDLDCFPYLKRIDFSYCESLTTVVGAIPATVTDLSYAFCSCTSLTGVIQIDSLAVEYEGCFEDTEEQIIIYGSAPKLSEIAATSSNGNVTAMDVHISIGFSAYRTQANPDNIQLVMVVDNSASAPLEYFTIYEKANGGSWNELTQLRNISTAWTKDGNTYTLVTPLSGRSESTTYNYRASASNSYITSGEKSATLPKAFRTFNIGQAGMEVAFGGVAKLDSGETLPEEGLFKCDMKAKFTGGFIRTDALLNFFYPVGTVYETTKTEAEFNPNTHWGGTWDRISGKMLVGYDANDSSFNTMGGTGGEKAHTLSATEMPSHAHGPTIRSYFLVSNANIAVNGTSRNFPSTGGGHYIVYSNVSGAGIDEATSTAAAGGSGAHNNLPPYQVVNIWKRIA